jgi:peptide-methionine (S)-S-oxide reductase
VALVFYVLLAGGPVSDSTASAWVLNPLLMFRSLLSGRLSSNSYNGNKHSMSSQADASLTGTAYFGGGCFWGMEKWFKKQFNVDGATVQTAVGYMGGKKDKPTYEEVCTGTTGHAEVLRVNFDPSKTKYADLVRYFFRIHDPTTLNRQGNDRGTQYRSAVFFTSPDQHKLAEEVKQAVSSEKHFPNPIVTEISPADTFYPAEPYHQNYLDANPGGYCNHRPHW